MTERLEQLEHRYEELSAQLSAPETYADTNLVARLNREQRELEPVVGQYRALRQAQQELSEAEALLHDPDGDVRAMARDELPGLKARVEELSEQLTLLLQPGDRTTTKMPSSRCGAARAARRRRCSPRPCAGCT